MGSEKFDLFLILLKLKSYLVSLIDKHDDGINPFELTEEFLERKYPDRKDEIIDLLNSNNIISDSQIALDEKIHLKFKEIVQQQENSSDLISILEKFNIDSIHTTNREITLNEIKTIREEKLKKIITVLFQLAQIWTQRGELEENVDDFSILEEEDLIRPNEQRELGKLDDDTIISFRIISKLSHEYLECLIDYYFQFGGDIVLPDFIKGVEEFKTVVEKKYKDLFNKSGLF